MLLTDVSPDDLLSERLCQVIDWSKDLPENIFHENDYRFHFFERSVLDNSELLRGIVESNWRTYVTDSFVSFGVPKTIAYAQFILEGDKIEHELVTLQNKFKDFFGGTVNYPIVLSNKNLDWFAFESAYEELGVLAVRDSDVKAGEFVDYFNNGALISCVNMKANAPGYSELLLEFKGLITVLNENYCSNC
ncbi:hypothetical protein FNU76_22075 [Chitinimonas arctica]|uniref:Uncharacterized protein n=1 Tax=Chitinimonas arctica TaxID=2594795 RepID=A0A516SKY0_9NEIS|nr:hypothetical protein [Chitinimonas arctica]QDQ28821.1 hypothetical protein FNU76_22075 [Chitinimonas arctica]